MYSARWVFLILQQHSLQQHNHQVKLMHKQPRRVHPEQLAVEAVDLMESHRINQVLVADTDGRLVGALHIHDLTRAKVI